MNNKENNILISLMRKSHLNTTKLKVEWILRRKVLKEKWK
jgi:hypothetical protein